MVRQKSREGAAGWYLVGSAGQKVMEVACGSVYYGPLVLSPFMAEARALPTGFEAVKGLQDRGPNNWIRTEIPCLWESLRTVVRV